MRQISTTTVLIFSFFANSGWIWILKLWIISWLIFQLRYHYMQKKHRNSLSQWRLDLNPQIMDHKLIVTPAATTTCQRIILTFLTFTLCQPQLDLNPQIYDNLLIFLLNVLCCWPMKHSNFFVIFTWYQQLLYSNPQTKDHTSIFIRTTAI